MIIIITIIILTIIITITIIITVKNLFIPNLAEKSWWKPYKGKKTTPIKC